MSFELLIANSDADIEACLPAFLALRPHLSSQGFLPQVRRQQAASYQMLALRHEGQVKSVAGFRIAEFLAWGKVLYIDDLSTPEAHRGQGFAGAVLDWLVQHAKDQHCAAVHLDTGYMRHAAHRSYLRKGFVLDCHHLALAL